MSFRQLVCSLVKHYVTSINSVTRRRLQHYCSQHFLDIRKRRISTRQQVNCTIIGNVSAIQCNQMPCNVVSVDPPGWGVAQHCIINNQSHNHLVHRYVRLRRMRIHSKQNNNVMHSKTVLQCRSVQSLQINNQKQVLYLLHNDHGENYPTHDSCNI